VRAAHRAQALHRGRRPLQGLRLLPHRLPVGRRLRNQLLDGRLGHLRHIHHPRGQFTGHVHLQRIVQQLVDQQLVVQQLVDQQLVDQQLVDLLACGQPFDLDAAVT
jgi:hypothetical protein